MKIRESYVSNSSSSSFILKAAKGIAMLTSSDWNEMIRDLFKDYEKTVKEHKEFLRSEGYSEEEWGMFPYCAFDLKTERAEAEKELKDILDGWTASNCVIVGGKMRMRKRDIDTTWRKYCDKMEKVIANEVMKNSDYDAVLCNLSCETRESIRDSRFNNIYAYKGDKCNKLRIPKKHLTEIEKKWDELGICTNVDVLLHKDARFAVHFDENEWYSIQGVMDEGSGWETESWTYGRLCEVFAKWLVAHNKVSPDFGWKELVDATLTVNMHEG